MLPLSLSTQFADAERLSADRVRAQNRAVTAEPLVQGLLDAFPEPAVVLNEQRQIVFANDKLAAMLGRSRSSLLGRRPGEVLSCEHCRDEEGGCGTSEHCRTCGAVRAVLNSLESGTPDTQECRLTRETQDGPAAMDLRVCATPIAIGGETFTIFAIRDITDEKRRLVLERIFFHDLLNAAGGLKGILEIWPDLSGEEALELSRTARGLSDGLIEEILAQRDLTAAERGDLAAAVAPLDAARLLVRLCILYSHHTTAEGKRIAPPVISGDTMIESDEVILGRVLGNLIKNALEASHKGQTVTVSFTNDGSPAFSVHNSTAMPEDVRLQMFQRSFTTKEGEGRGIGTYSVKLLTERYLKGSVVFRSSAGEGTTFTIRLP